MFLGHRLSVGEQRAMRLEKQEPAGEDAIPNLKDLNFGELLKDC